MSASRRASPRICWSTSSPQSPTSGSTAPIADATPTISSYAVTMSLETFSYALYRLVPRIERGECVNVGVVVFCRPQEYLAARTALDETRVRALWPELD